MPLLKKQIMHKDQCYNPPFGDDLCTIDLPENASLVLFADEIVLLTTARTTRLLVNTRNITLETLR